MNYLECELIQILHWKLLISYRKKIRILSREMTFIRFNFYQEIEHKQLMTVERKMFISWPPSSPSIDSIHLKKNQYVSSFQCALNGWSMVCIKININVNVFTSHLLQIALRCIDICRKISINKQTVCWLNIYFNRNKNELPIYKVVIELKAMTTKNVCTHSISIHFVHWILYQFTVYISEQCIHFLFKLIGVQSISYII